MSADPVGLVCHFFCLVVVHSLVDLVILQVLKTFPDVVRVSRTTTQLPLSACLMVSSLLFFSSMLALLMSSGTFLSKSRSSIASSLSSIMSNLLVMEAGSWLVVWPVILL